MNPQLKQVRDEIFSHLEDPNFLSESLLKLAAININLGIEMAEAHLAETVVANNYLSQIPMEGEKKMSNAEAEKKAIVETFNNYEKLKTQLEGTLELMQVIKKRLEILGWDYKGTR